MRDRQAARASIAARYADQRDCARCKKRQVKPGCSNCQECIDGATERKRLADRTRKRQQLANARVNGLCLMCTRHPVEPGRTCCEACAYSKTPEGRDLAAYVPFDEWISNPTNQILRAIRRFGWVDAADLANALGLPSFSDDKRGRDRFLRSLLRTHRRGLVERRTAYDLGGREVFEYRLAPGVVTDPPFDSAVCDDGYREVA